MLRPMSVLHQAVDFLCSSLDAVQIRGAIVFRATAAKVRSDGLESLLNTFKANRDSPALFIVLKDLGKYLRKAWQLSSLSLLQTSANG